MSHALDKPEIRDLIARVLSLHDLTQCAQVSRSWRSSFEPWVWYELKISSFEGNWKLVHQALQRHREAVKRVRIIAMPKNSFFPDMSFPRLKRLHLRYKILPGSFLNQHRSMLTHLDLNYDYWHVGSSRDHSLHWQAASSCPSLTSLTMHNINITPAVWPSFYDLWSRLRQLHLYNLRMALTLDDNNTQDQGTQVMPPPSSLASSSPISVEPFFRNLPCSSTIRDLGLFHLGLFRRQMVPTWFSEGSQTTEYLSLLRSCPEIESFSCAGYGFGNCRNGMGDSLAETLRDRCPKLVKLSMDQVDALSNDKIRPVMLMLRSEEENRRSPIKSLSMQGSLFSDHCYQELASFSFWAINLETLELECALSVKSHMVHDLLCSLPNLKTFSAQRLFERDLLVDPRPWVCLGLIRFKILIMDPIITEARPDHSSSSPPQPLLTLSGYPVESTRNAILQRIGKTFRSLKYMSLTSDYAQSQFGLDHGLEFLSDLVAMEGLEFYPGEDPRLTDQDIRWMLAHWPRLRYIVGPLHGEDRKVQHGLERVLRAHGVRRSADDCKSVGIF